MAAARVSTEKVLLDADAISRTLTPVVSQGDGPFTYAWYPSNAAFNVHGPNGPASVWAALEGIAETRPEAVLLDLSMPDMVGSRRSPTFERAIPPSRSSSS